MKSFFKKIIFTLLLFRAQKVVRTTPHIIGLTGSVGKTSTRMAIAAVLATEKKCHTSPENFNTPFGLLLAILGIEKSGTSAFDWLKIVFKIWTTPLPSPEILVLEMGVDAKGDMKALLQIVKPTTVVFTPIALAHSAEGQFQSVDEIRTEKIQLANAAEHIFVNTKDTKTVDALQEKFGTRVHILSAEKVESRESGLSFSMTGFEYHAPIFGNFQTSILLPAIALGRAFGVKETNIHTALSTFIPPAGRGRLLSGKNKSNIWDFSYNSSPKAAEAVLESLGNITFCRQKKALLGTMNELGKFSAEQHEKLGKLTARNADEIYFVGDFFKDFERGVAKKVPLFFFENAKSAGNFLKEKLHEGDIILVKGSQNGVFLEEAVAILLADKTEKKKLCRQSAEWQRKKA